GMDVENVKSSANDNAALGQRAERHWHKRADRGKDNCRIDFFRRHLIRTASPYRAQFLCGLLRCNVTWPRKHEEVAPFIKRNLCDQVGGVAKTINAKPSRVARFAIGTITN